MARDKVILLVDDDTDFLTANRLALESAGFQVHTARNSAEAMETAIRVNPGAAVLDVMMDLPDEGFVLARTFKQDPRTRDIRLVLLSSVNEINRRKGLAFRFSDHDRDEQWLPVDRVLDKPVRPKKLVALLEELLEGGP
jgi:two-component system, OmpR family, alkaline phosphatase synthesis response regulator PhoP